jgi:hypothetical protein
MLTKVVFALVSVFVFSGAVYAEEDSASGFSPDVVTAIKKSDVHKSKPSLSAEAEFSYSTLTFSQVSGEGDNILGITPALKFDFSPETTAHLKIPMFWSKTFGATEGVPNAQAPTEREIGRPEIGLWTTGFDSWNAKFQFGLDLRLPLADDTSGSAQIMRVWGLYPGYKAQVRLGNTALHLVNNGGLVYNTGYDEGNIFDDGLGNVYQSFVSISNPVVISESLGLGLIFEKASVDLTANIYSGLGQGHFSGDGFSGETGSADLSYLKLRGNFALTDTTQLSAYVVQGLKQLYNHSITGLNIDDVQNIASFSAGLNVAQQF